MKKITLLTTLCLMLSANAAQNCHDDITATAPASHFTVNPDNTVTDNTTGLTWMRCSLGQTGDDCSGGSAETYTWAGALDEVANNHSGWRLPNIKELTSIMELKCVNPGINTTIFPNTPSSSYWSSSPYADYNSYAWGVNFSGGGNAYYGYKSSGNYVRLVRGGQ